MSKELKNPSVLAFESKLVCSDAVMHAGTWQQRHESTTWSPVTVTEKSVRGTISNRLKPTIAKDPNKVNAEIEKANLQTVDNAALPFDCDTLKLDFTLRALGDLSTPTTCNAPAYQTALKSVVTDYVTEHGFQELAKRYALNLANGRFLWRNRIGADSIEIQVRFKETCWTFDAYSYSLRDFSTSDAQIDALAEQIQLGLLGENAPCFEVTAYVKLGYGQTVFPSQELVMNTGKGDKSKFLYQISGIAAMHSQKIGNALRTIDTWHSQGADVGAIAVEPFGAVTTRGQAYRQPSQKEDFYNLLDNWVLKGKIPAAEQQHYVMAVLIRGGVFGE